MFNDIEILEILEILDTTKKQYDIDSNESWSNNLNYKIDLYSRPIKIERSGFGYEEGFGDDYDITYPLVQTDKIEVKLHSQGDTIEGDYDYDQTYYYTKEEFLIFIKEEFQLND